MPARCRTGVVSAFAGSGRAQSLRPGYAIRMRVSVLTPPARRSVRCRACPLRLGCMIPLAFERVKKNDRELLLKNREYLRMTESGRFVAIGLGSNLGDRQGNLARALQCLREVIHIERISPVYESAPVGYTHQPDFLNLTCAGRTRLSARELHDALRTIERRSDAPRHFRWDRARSISTSCCSMTS